METTKEKKRADKFYNENLREVLTNKVTRHVGKSFVEWLDDGAVLCSYDGKPIFYLNEAKNLCSYVYSDTDKPDRDKFLNTVFETLNIPHKVCGLTVYNTVTNSSIKCSGDKERLYLNVWDGVQKSIGGNYFKTRMACIYTAKGGSDVTPTIFDVLTLANLLRFRVTFGGDGMKYLPEKYKFIPYTDGDDTGWYLYLGDHIIASAFADRFYWVRVDKGGDICDLAQLFSHLFSFTAHGRNFLFTAERRPDGSDTLEILNTETGEVYTPDETGLLGFSY